MPSKDWYKQNPKVSAHIPQELYKQLQEFMELRGIAKASIALKTILSEYLVSSKLSTVENPDEERLQALEITVCRMLQQLNNLENHTLNPMTRIISEYSKDDEIDILRHKVDILFQQLNEIHRQNQQSESQEE